MEQNTGCTRSFSVEVKRSDTSPLEAVLTFSIGLDTILAHKPGLGVNSLRGALAALTAATDERLAELAQELEKQLTGCVLVDPTRPVGRDLANAIMDCVERWETQERREKQAQEEQRRKVQQDMLAGLANRLVEAVPSRPGVARCPLPRFSPSGLPLRRKPARKLRALPPAVWYSNAVTMFGSFAAGRPGAGTCAA